jgi:LmbE family N-acetylglucosaminyl deacetylase
MLLLVSASSKGSIPSPRNLPTWPALAKEDRLLVLAPHEDDEALGAGGVIQRAISIGAQVRVVYLTYGDHNEWAFLAYRKSPILTPQVNLRMGRLRRKEATAAMQSLGLSPEHLVFLGFPDNGTLTIWRQHWGSAPVFHSLLTETTSVPYVDALCTGRPYKGEEILAAIEGQLLNFKPTRILVTHPIDSNPDHRALYLFLQVALLDLKGRLGEPAVYCYPVHFGKWPRPMRYHPDRWLEVPPMMAEDTSPWYSFTLDPKETQRKAAAIRLNKSQMADHGYWLVSLARKNELFVQPQPVHLSTAAWTGTQEVAPTSGEQGSSADHVGRAAYEQTPNALVAHVRLRYALHGELGVTLTAFGYRKDRSFADMPKLRLRWQFRRLHVLDQETPLDPTNFGAREEKREVVFVVPWKQLGYPAEVFAQVQGQIGDIPSSRTSWQVLVPSNYER